MSDIDANGKTLYERMTGKPPDPDYYNFDPRQSTTTPMEEDCRRRQQLDDWYKNTVADVKEKGRAIELKEKELAEREAKLKEVYTHVDERQIALFNMNAVPNQCPECLYTLELTLMSDRIRIRFRHPGNDGCSHTMTEFYRPLAQFTTFI